MTDTATCHVWQAEEYHQHSSAQRDAASQLLHHINLLGNERILDIGCGDGKISAAIASYVQAGSILGIDVSSEMIEFARKKFPKERYTNLTFLLQDASQLHYNGEFNVIFSSFALQWVLDHNAFLKSAYNSLTSLGYFVATIPLGVSLALEQSISEVLSIPKWAPHFLNFVQHWRFTSQSEFADLLTLNQLVPVRIETVDQEVIFPSRETFEKYVLQWFAYLRPLPEPLKPIFFKQIIDRYFEIEPMLENCEVRFVFPRLDVIARKSNL